jgi:hypothetical protein
VTRCTSTPTPLVLAGVALALVAVVIGALVVRADRTGERGGVATRPHVDTVPAGPAPIGMLVAKRDGSLVVLGTQDGAQHSSLGTFPGISTVSVSPDGRQVYFSATGASGACRAGSSYDDVTKLVPATGKTTPVVGGALSPAVSPDGKFVVYGISCDGRGPGFTNLLTGENSRSDALGSKAHESSNLVETTEPLAWSPDSSRVLFRLGLQGDPRPHFYVDRLWPVVPQADTKVVDVPDGPDITAAAFVDNDTLAIAEVAGARTEVRSWRIIEAGDERTPLLFTLPGQVTSLVADPAGQHFLAATAAGDLYRWSIGDDAPTLVGHGVSAAAWLPWS